MITACLLAACTKEPPAEQVEAPPAPRLDASPAARAEAPPAPRLDASPAARTEAPPAPRLDAPPTAQAEAPPAPRRATAQVTAVRETAQPQVPSTAQAMVQATGRPGAGAPAARPARSRNLQVLPRSMGKRQIKRRMRQMSKALGVRCAFCHVAGDMAADTPNKETARQMMRMVEAINTRYLKEHGARVTCRTCHRGHKQPPR